MKFHPLSSPSSFTSSFFIMKTTNPMNICHCRSFGCKSTQDQVAGIGVFPGITLARDAYQENQRCEDNLEAWALSSISSLQLGVDGSLELSSLDSISKWEGIFPIDHVWNEYWNESCTMNPIRVNHLTLKGSQNRILLEILCLCSWRKIYANKSLSKWPSWY